MTEFQSKPVTPIVVVVAAVDGAHQNIGGTHKSGVVVVGHVDLIQTYLINFLSWIYLSYTEWREFEGDLIIYSKSTKNKQIISSFILILLFGLTLWNYWKIKIF